MPGNLANTLQVWGFEENFILFQDGAVGFALELTPLDITCWDEATLDQLASRIDQFLNGLPPHVDIQFMQEITSGNRGLLAKYLNSARRAQNPMIKTLTRSRVQKLSGLDSEGLLPEFRLKVFARTQAPKGKLAKPKLLSKNGDFAKLTEHELTHELRKGARLQEEIIHGLLSLGLTSRPIKVQEVVELMYRDWNPTRPIRLSGFDPEDIRTSILFTDALISEKGFSLGEMHFRVISLKILPEVTFASMAASLQELPFDSKLFLTIHIPDQQKEITKLQTQRRIAFSMARGKRSGVADIESEAKFQDLETLLGQMIAQGEKVFHVSFNILIRSKSEDELETQIAHALSKVRELSGAEAMVESLASFDIFSEFAPPNARASTRSKSLKTTNLSDFLPIFGPWKGHTEPSILLRSRAGSLVKFDPFSLTNYNQLISGGSGSGKSFCANILLLQILKENPKVFIVDIGGSYKKICNLLDGQYVKLGTDSPISLNPFDLADGAVDPSGDKIKFLVSLVEIIAREEGVERLPKLERAEIEEAIQKCYEVTSKPQLSTLQKILAEHNDITIRRYARILSTWCGDSPYGRLIDRPTTLMLDKPFVAFDLKGLESHPDLQSVYLFIITDLVWREIQPESQRGLKKLLIFDECWKLLENDTGASFIAEVFRTFRKYRAGVIAISQDMEDFAKSKVASGILSNSATKWILMQRGANQERLKEILQLNDKEMALISSLHQEKGVYSEAFLIAQDDKSVVSIDSTPLEYWIATTDPRDVAALDEFVKVNPNLKTFEILKALSEKFPTGVARKDVS